MPALPRTAARTREEVRPSAGQPPPSSPAGLDAEALRTLPKPEAPPIDVDGLKKDIASASPEQRIRLLELLQSSAGIQELVKAGRRASSEEVPTVVTGDFNAVLLT